ncbi:MAG: SAM-dependent methyltransferase [Deltaproteobacteria bacterium]|nr:SAM-dependent methyltransferase [Deltaproteobacteria bacterium]
MAGINNCTREHGSFRDPSGFIFHHDGSIYRQINLNYKVNYDHLIASNLYDVLVAEELLIPHKEVDLSFSEFEGAYKIIQPEKIPFISYPYEWCFTQLKDAALTTLSIQKKSLEFGMSLKDSSAYNIQFTKGKPVLIDTLSFEKYKDGQPWIGYRQFCQHFLAPLALMSYTDVRLNKLFRVFIDGIPLDLAKSLLPFKSFFRFSIFSHIHIHAKYQNKFADKYVSPGNKKISHRGILGIIDNLESAIRKLTWSSAGTEWDDYYGKTNYTSDAFQKKRDIVSEFIDRLNPGEVWDIGANTGLFSRIAVEKGIKTISFDVDPACVEKNYLDMKNDSEQNLLPLLLDLTNPSPGLGWQHHERMSILERGPTDTILALALVHHLAISNNLPLDRIAEFLAKLGNSLIIEFVPKSDSQVKRLLSSREDVFPDYTQQGFENNFRKYFQIENAVKIKGTPRTLYLMLMRQE